jgi:hypothetical protein
MRMADWWLRTSFIRLPWHRSPDRRRRTRFTSRLPSALAGVYFDAKIEAYWYITDFEYSHKSEGALVRDRARAMAAALSKTLSPIDAQAAEDAVNARVGVARAMSSDIPIVVWARVRLAINGDDARMVARHLEVQRQEGLQRQLELGRLEYLRREVFQNRTLARLWWAEHNPERLDALLSTAFDAIVEEAAQEAPRADEAQTHLMALVRRFVERLQEPRERLLFLQIAHVVLVKCEQKELAAAVETEIRGEVTAP